MQKEEILEALMQHTREHSFIPEFDELASFLSCELQELTTHFENTDAAIVFYFELLFEELEHQQVQIEELNQLSFGESFSHLVFSCMDFLENEALFSKLSLQVVESSLLSSSKIEHLIKPRLEQFVHNDTRISTTAHVLVGDLFYKQLICDWEFFIRLGLEKSLSSDQWVERVDKFSSLTDSILHSDVADKGLDYLKTLYSQGVFTLKRLF